jgi:hypothetical protein
MKFKLIKMVLKCTSFLGVLCILTTPAAFATVWDLAADYSVSSNPNGQWSFGWEDWNEVLGGPLNTFNKYNSNNGGAGWSDSLRNPPSIWKNTSGSSQNGVASGEVALHPGSDGDFSVVRWVAPSAGEFSFKGYFGAGDSGSMSYYIYDGALSIRQWKNDPGTETFSFTRTMAANEAIDFAVGAYVATTGPDNRWGSTPLDLKITDNNAPVPEPATMLLMVFGSGIMGTGIRRLRKKMRR